MVAHHSSHLLLASSILQLTELCFSRLNYDLHEFVIRKSHGVRVKEAYFVDITLASLPGRTADVRSPSRVLPPPPDSGRPRVSSATSGSLPKHESWHLYPYHRVSGRLARRPVVKSFGRLARRPKTL